MQSRKEDLPTIEEWDWKVEFSHNAFSVIIYSYCAIETYVNSYIERHKIKLKNKRRYSLQEKLNIVLGNLWLEKIEEFNPQIWNNFLELEGLRDKIIHSKFSYYMVEDPNWSDLLISKIFNWKFKWKKTIASKIIEYMKNKEPKNNWNVFRILKRWLQSNPIS